MNDFSTVDTLGFDNLTSIQWSHCPALPHKKLFAVAQKINLFVTRLIEKVLRWILLFTANLTSVSIINEIFYREKEGVEIQAHFEGHPHLEKFKDFNVIPTPVFDKNPLTPSQESKAKILLENAYKKLEQSHNYTPGERQEARKHYNLYASFYTKNLKPKATRNDYTLADWKILDHINFELIQDHFNTLCHLFNSSCFEQIQREMEQTLGINYKEALIGEVLAKSLAYIGNLDGKKISLPVKEEEGTFKLVDFTIKCQLLGDGLPSYLLENENRQVSPWVVVRGTEPNFWEENGHPMRPGAFESVLADTIDPSGIAESVVIKAIVKEADHQQPGQETLRQFFNRQKAGHVNLTGHSLGGYLVNDLAVRFPNKLKTAYGFNAPAVSQALGEDWNQLIKEGKLKKEQIVNFDTEGDFIAGAGLGEGLIGKRIAISPTHSTTTLDPIHSHLKLDLSVPFKAQEVDVKQEQKKCLRKHVHQFRAFIGKVLKAFMAIEATLDTDIRPDWWVNREEYSKRFYELKVQAQI